MNRRSSLVEHFVEVKSLMGLERFEVRFFFGHKFTKIDLAHKGVIENRSKVVYTLSVMFITISLKYFGSKVLWEHHSIEHFLHS